MGDEMTTQCARQSDTALDKFVVEDQQRLVNEYVALKKRYATLKGHADELEKDLEFFNRHSSVSQRLAAYKAAKQRGEI